jgi:hypothetical protein
MAMGEIKRIDSIGRGADRRAAGALARDECEGDQQRC